MSPNPKVILQLVVVLLLFLFVLLPSCYEVFASQCVDRKTDEEDGQEIVKISSLRMVEYVGQYGIPNNEFLFCFTKKEPDLGVICDSLNTYVFSFLGYMIN